MIPEDQNPPLQMICVIVREGLGSAVLRMAKRQGVTGGAIFLGKGTVSGKILEKLGLDREEREIVQMASSQKVAEEVFEKLRTEFKIEKPNHGIAFTTPIRSCTGARCYAAQLSSERKGADPMKYHEITVIVDKGRAEDVIDAAVRAGARGGTIFNARGSGVHETGRLFSMDVEPEKEIVLMVSEEDRTDAIVDAVREKLRLDEPGNGILFVQEVACVLGIYR